MANGDDDCDVDVFAIPIESHVSGPAPGDHELSQVNASWPPNEGVLFQDL